MENRPTKVLKEAKQVGETHSRWGWVEPCVWTERMLTTLENGVKGCKWFSLIDKVQSKENLAAAAKQVMRNKGIAGVDHVSVEAFRRRLDENLEGIRNELQEGRYRPLPVMRVMIPKGQGKTRPLGIPTVKDRVVQTAVRQVIEPIFEKEFLPSSWGFRPKRGCRHALKEVDTLMGEGYKWVVDADIKGYFDSIPHDKLMKQVGEKVADGRVLEMIKLFLNQEIHDGKESWEPEEGTPQGAVISPLLANIYLHPLDKKMKAEGYRMTRYADDLVVLCRTQEEAMNALAELKAWMQEAGLELSEEKTRVVDMSLKGQWIEFLGYHFQVGEEKIRHWPRKKSLMKLREAIREKTKRCNGHGLKTIIHEVNKILRGWFGYYKYSYWRTFVREDAWIRMRLRSVLRKRSGRSGCGRGFDHRRWPNAYFEAEGLFSMCGAFKAIVSPQTR